MEEERNYTPTKKSPRRRWTGIISGMKFVLQQTQVWYVVCFPLIATGKKSFPLFVREFNCRIRLVSRSAAETHSETEGSSLWHQGQRQGRPQVQRFEIERPQRGNLTPAE